MFMIYAPTIVCRSTLKVGTSLFPKQHQQQQIQPQEEQNLNWDPRILGSMKRNDDFSSLRLIGDGLTSAVYSAIEVMTGFAEC
jgi:hypothetical protein